MKQNTGIKDEGNLSSCRVLGVDLAKRVFQVAGETSLGEVVYEGRIKSREAFSAFLSRLPSGLTVLMETGPGAQSWARQLLEQGHAVRILPAQRVAEHRSGAKNDRNDTHAILRAGRDAGIMSVPIKSTQVLAMQALHRVRQGYIRRRTALGNQMRGLLLEHDIALAQGDAALVRGVGCVLDGASRAVPSLLLELLAEMLAEWKHLGQRIDALTGRLQASARQDPKARQLMSARGIGPVTATAILAKQLDPAKFANARKFAAYFGMVPDQHSSGSKTRLGKMSKRGDGYLRSIMVQGAHSVLRHLAPGSRQPDDQRLLRWVQRHGKKGAAVRLANRNLRIIWVMLQNDQKYRRQPERRLESAMND
jgi:transposase